VGQRLLAAGLVPGDRVALFMRNHPRYLELMFGAWWAGLAVVPINAKLHLREAQWIVDHAQARWVFVTSDTAPCDASAFAGMRTRPAAMRGWGTVKGLARPWPTGRRTTWPGCSTPAAPRGGPKA
jgi:acyl-CoA synthetase (AMP-forming)/AMP-acid ligase II